MTFILYSVLGLFIGSFGSLVGVGGGFILVPILMSLRPEFTPLEITSISILGVAINSTSASFAYFKQRQIHLKSALLFTLAGIPGAWLGSSLTKLINRSRFELFFGIVLILLSPLLFWKSKNNQNKNNINEFLATKNTYIKGGIISLFIGVMASFLGVGGGIIHVPLMIHGLSFPVHLATGTSNFILAGTAWITTISHLIKNNYPQSMTFAWFIYIGMFFGSQIGAKYSKKVKGITIMKILCLAIFLIGFKLVFHSFK